MCPEGQGKEQNKGGEKQTRLWQAGARPLFWPRPQDSEVWEALLFSVVQILCSSLFFLSKPSSDGTAHVCASLTCKRQSSRVSVL